MSIVTKLTITIDLRICYLRDKDRVERWREEIILCRTDLECIERYFAYQKNKWAKWEEEAKAANKPGHACYAHKQKEMWAALEKRARAAIVNTSQKLKGVDLGDS